MAEVRKMQEHFPAKSAPLYHIPAASGNACLRPASPTSDPVLDEAPRPFDIGIFVQACFPKMGIFVQACFP